MKPLTDDITLFGTKREVVYATRLNEVTPAILEDLSAMAKQKLMVLFRHTPDEQVRKIQDIADSYRSLGVFPCPAKVTTLYFFMYFAEGWNANVRSGPKTIDEVEAGPIYKQWLANGRDVSSIGDHVLAGSGRGALRQFAEDIDTVSAPGMTTISAFNLHDWEVRMYTAFCEGWNAAKEQKQKISGAN